LLFGLDQVVGWQLDQEILILNLKGQFFLNNLTENKDWLLCELRRWRPTLNEIKIVTSDLEEPLLDDWEEQKRVWLEIFRGQEKN